MKSFLRSSMLGLALVLASQSIAFSAPYDDLKAALKAAQDAFNLLPVPTPPVVVPPVVTPPPVVVVPPPPPPVVTGKTYYLSPTGNDSRDGLTLANAWLTPNHAVNCGDVIIRSAGNYSSQNFSRNRWGVVANCPSSSGIWFAELRCAGPYVSSCVTTGSGATMIVDKSNWAVVGGIGTSTNDGCWMATPSSPTKIHHIAFINVICNGAYQNGVAMFPFYGDFKAGVDYFAVVGAITYDAAKGGAYCFSGVSTYEPVNWDTNPGTHIYISGVFSIANLNPPCSGNSDGNGIIFDDWNGTQNSHIVYTGQGVAENNILLGNGAAGLTVYQSSAPIFLFNNTTYGNYISAIHQGTFNGELALSFAKNVTAQRNIFQATRQKQNNNNIYAAYVGFGDLTVKVSENFIFGVAGQHTGINNSPSFVWGTNTYATPNLVNPVIPGPQTCPTAVTTTGCMIPTIANFKPQTVGAVTLGYQPPGPCKPNSYYPVWLKGVVPDGIITKPCGL